MPIDDLFVVQPVELTNSIESIVSSAGLKATCDTCGEEIINGRQILHDGKVWCRACLFGAYYTSVTVSTPSVVMEVRP
jgi:formylmethanofuran dehydrogenase subunit E